MTVEKKKLFRVRTMVSTPAQFLIWNESLLSIYAFRRVGVASVSVFAFFFQEVRSNFLSAQRSNLSKTAHTEGRWGWSITLIVFWRGALTPEIWFYVNCAALIIWSLPARHLSPRGSGARHVVRLVVDEVSASSPEVQHNEEAVSTCSRRVAGISPVWDVMPSGRACCASFVLTFDWLAVNRSWTGDRSERNSARDTVYCTEADKMLTVSFLFCAAAPTTGLHSYYYCHLYNKI